MPPPPANTIAASQGSFRTSFQSRGTGTAEPPPSAKSNPELPGPRAAPRRSSTSEAVRSPSVHGSGALAPITGQTHAKASSETSPPPSALERRESGARRVAPAPAGSVLAERKHGIACRGTSSRQEARERRDRHQQQGDGDEGGGIGGGDAEQQLAQEAGQSAAPCSSPPTSPSRIGTPSSPTQPASSPSSTGSPTTPMSPPSRPTATAGARAKPRPPHAANASHEPRRR